MGCKAAKTTHNINNAFDPGTANKRTVQWWFKKFCKGDESLWAFQSAHKAPIYLAFHLSSLLQMPNVVEWLKLSSLTTSRIVLRESASVIAFSWPLSTSSSQTATTSSSISTTFCRENTSTTSRKQKMLSKSFSNPKAWIFMLQE